MTIKVYFNNSCSICRFEINHYKKLPQGDIDWIDVTDNKVAESILNKSAKELIRRMHVMEDGKIFTGARAFLKVWSQIPRYKVLYYILRIQPLLFCFEILYEVLAFFLYLKNRNQVKKYFS
jgi:predicted DCC family thiol-disulfide oxidoreductase YuxK